MAADTESLVGWDALLVVDIGWDALLVVDTPPVPVGAKVHVQRGRPGYLQDPSRDMLHGLLHRLQMC